MAVVFVVLEPVSRFFRQSGRRKNREIGDKTLVAVRAGGPELPLMRIPALGRSFTASELKQEQPGAGRLMRIAFSLQSFP